MAASFTEGTPVRLTFDERPTVGHVLSVDSTAGRRLYLLEFPSDGGSHDGMFLEGKAARFRLPEVVLVPVCEWVETFAELEIPCHHDASMVARGHDDIGDIAMNVCRDHAADMPSRDVSPITA